MESGCPCIIAVPTPQLQILRRETTRYGERQSSSCCRCCKLPLPLLLPVWPCAAAGVAAAVPAEWRRVGLGGFWQYSSVFLDVTLSHCSLPTPCRMPTAAKRHPPPPQPALADDQRGTTLLTVILAVVFLLTYILALAFMF